MAGSEENLLHVIAVIRAGLDARSESVPPGVGEPLERLCDDEGRYVSESLPGLIGDPVTGPDAPDESEGDGGD